MFPAGGTTCEAAFVGIGSEADLVHLAIPTCGVQTRWNSDRRGGWSLLMKSLKPQ